MWRLQALVGVAEAVASLHSAGYVYQALRPSNVALVLPERAWMLIDFSAVARAGAYLREGYALLRVRSKRLVATVLFVVPSPARPAYSAQPSANAVISS